MIIRDFIISDGIKIFDKDILDNHTDYNAKGLDNLFQAEEKHFWFQARKEYIFDNMQNHIPKDEKIIEIGAGTGNVSRHLKQNGYNDISVGEMHLNGLKYAKKYGIEDCYQFDLLDTPFDDEFDTICMFDVLEHIEDDDLALQNIAKSLKSDGDLVLTVPAHTWLWNRDDAIAHHKRRYTKQKLIKKLEKNNFQIIEARYFFITITPLLYLRTILNRDDGSVIKESEFSGDISINSLLNKILLAISRVENSANRFLPNWFGGSLFLIARQK